MVDLLKNQLQKVFFFFGLIIIHILHLNRLIILLPIHFEFFMDFYHHLCQDSRAVWDVALIRRQAFDHGLPPDVELSQIETVLQQMVEKCQILHNLGNCSI